MLNIKRLERANQDNQNRYNKNFMKVEDLFFRSSLRLIEKNIQLVAAIVVFH
jgi:hypothetical protein